eukprot:8791011-Pyramimonas_sp.AAC.1
MHAIVVSKRARVTALLPAWSSLRVLQCQGRAQPTLNSVQNNPQGQKHVRSSFPLYVLQDAPCPQTEQHFSALSARGWSLHAG